MDDEIVQYKNRRAEAVEEEYVGTTKWSDTCWSGLDENGFDGEWSIYAGGFILAGGMDTCEVQDMDKRCEVLF